MRYIGNKTRLLAGIQEFMAGRGLRGGTLLDLFAGTTAVGRHFKRAGWRVYSNDWAAYSEVFGKAYLETNAVPRFRKLLERPFLRDAVDAAVVAPLAGNGPPETTALRAVVAWLNNWCPLEDGLFTRQFSPAGPMGRMYFTAENAAKIDGIRNRLEHWRRMGWIGPGEFHLLLAALIEAADRVANISGVYGAYLKHFQLSARRPLALAPPEVIRSRRVHRVFREDANALAARLRTDVLYVDPPYNHRQYAANYHVLEILSELHTVAPALRKAYEDGLYGKTGLRPYRQQVSDWCKAGARGRSPAARALEDLCTRARARALVFSYNEEGILDRNTLMDIFERASGGRFRPERDFLEMSYRRFRSDAVERASGGYRRQYRPPAGRSQDEVREWLFHVPLGG